LCIARMATVKKCLVPLDYWSVALRTGCERGGSGRGKKCGLKLGNATDCCPTQHLISMACVEFERRRNADISVSYVIFTAAETKQISITRIETLPTFELLASPVYRCDSVSLRMTAALLYFLLL